MNLASISVSMGINVKCKIITKNVIGKTEKDTSVNFLESIPKKFPLFLLIFWQK